MEYGGRILAKITPEFSDHTTHISLKKMKLAFGLKGSSVISLQTINMKDGDESVTGLEIKLRQYKSEIEEEEKIIPDGKPSARG